MSGLTRHRNTGWALAIFLANADYLFFFYMQYMLLSECAYVSWLCEGHQAKHMKGEAIFELLSGDKGAVCVFGQSQWSSPLQCSSVEANATRL